MKKRNEFDEFIQQLEEAIDNIIDEIDLPENRPVNIDISINLCPRMVFKSEDHSVQQPGKTPVDILETENNIHAVIALPGMEMENIRLIRSGRVLEITALCGDDEVKETIELPSRVNKTGMKTTYRNGILEMVFNKSKKVRKKKSIK